jgi:hypothetical protein
MFASVPASSFCKFYSILSQLLLYNINLPDTHFFGLNFIFWKLLTFLQVKLHFDGKLQKRVAGTKGRYFVWKTSQIMNVAT